MKIRLIFGIWACKAGILVSRLLGKGGTSMPGKLALTICPAMLRLLSAQVKKDIIVVCGTNGKTTTNNLLASFIRSRGHKVVCNDKGANMIWGVCCAFAEKASLWGTLSADFACLEVDEASAVKVLAHIKPKTMVITNLFRDQLDRYGDIETTVDFLRRALSLSPDTRLLLNGDDPLVAAFGENTDRECLFMSVVEDTGLGVDDAKDGRFCSFCGAPLDYEYYHYSQLGSFRCTGCSFRRREPDFKVSRVSLQDGLSFLLDYNGKTDAFCVNYRGFYNVYNIALSYGAALISMGEAPDYQMVLASYKPQVGRMESFTIGTKTVILNMAKNPAGFNQAIATLLQDGRKKDILIAVNDHESDGQDITWLWDVNFEALQNAAACRLVVSGLRADELMLRLKYAGFSEGAQHKCHEFCEAVPTAIGGDAPVCYMLANYTAVFPIQKILKETEGQSHDA